MVERAEIIREKGTNRSRFFRGQVDKYTWVDVGSSYLMSDVLASAPNGALLVTGLASSQMVHTAEVADLAAIVLVAGKHPESEALAFARQRKLPLLLTGLSMFEACSLLSRHGLRGAVRKE